MTGRIVLIVYVDDIIITGHDTWGNIEMLKTFLQGQFHTKDLGQRWYFLAIEVAQSKVIISLSQWKYVLKILEDTGMMGAKQVEMPMDPNVRFCVDQGKLLSSSKEIGREAELPHR